MLDINQTELAHREAYLNTLLDNNPDIQQSVQYDYAILQALYRDLPDPILITNTALEIIFTNPAFETIFEYEQDAILGQSITKLCVQPDAQSFLKNIVEETTQRQIQFINHNQVIIESLTRIIPLRINDELHGEIIVIKDITTTQQQQRQLGLLQNLAVDMIGTSDLEGRFQSLNPTWEKILGYQPHELINTDPRDFIHPSERQAAKIQFQKLKAGQRVHDFLVRFLCKDNSYKWLLWNALPILEENLFYFNIRDVTAIQDAQQKIEIQRRQLQLIHDITVKSGEGFSTQIEKLLEVGMDYFGLKQGVIKQKEGDYLRVIYIGEEGYEYQFNQRVEITQIMCQQVLDTFDVVATHDVATLPVEQKPASKFSGSYIGMPIWIRRDNIGTLAFFSKPEDKRREPFTNEDIEFMQMLGQLVNNLLPQRAAQVESDRIYNLTSDLIAIIDANGYFHRLSSAWSLSLGYDIDMLYAMRLPDLLHPEDKILWGFDLPTKFAEDLVTAPFEMRLRRADGSYQWISWSASVSIENLIYFVGHDITDRRRMLAELQVREHKLRSVLNSINDLIIVVNKHGYFIEFHVPPDDKTLYVPPEQALYKSVYDVMPEYMHDMLRTALNKVVETGTLQVADYWLDINGEQHWFSAHFSPLKSDNEEINAITCAIRDITDRKNLELELLNTNADMELRVQRRTRELEHINEELKNFAYIISHDLRNPLINIQGFVGELEYTLTQLQADYQLDIPQPQKQDLDESIEFIRSSANEMNQKIDAILRLSQMGRRELMFVDVNLDQVVEEELKTLAHKTKSVEIIVDDLPTIHADYIAMKIILGNLISNAIKYLNPERTGEIRISAAQTTEEIIISVEDNGRGIQPQQEHRVFQLFRRIDSAGDTDGEGMGLAYVQTLVRRHNGRIWFTSEFGQGSTFYVSLPIQLLQKAED